MVGLGVPGSFLFITPILPNFLVDKNLSLKLLPGENV